MRKRLRMVLYKPDCDSNYCELLSGQATPSTLAKDVACGVAACINRIPYPFDQLSGEIVFGLASKTLSRFPFKNHTH